MKNPDPGKTYIWWAIGLILVGGTVFVASIITP